MLLAVLRVDGHRGLPRDARPHADATVSSICKNISVRMFSSSIASWFSARSDKIVSI